MSLALYRKYRPSTFSDLIGQEITAKILQEAARQDRIAHAYLFSGPRGVGKTSIARLIAKTANCLTRASDTNFKTKGEPCNSCAACNAVNANLAFDVIEIDAASNRGIDEMRDLKENARTAPSQFQRKVFIIDEAHMLTKEAANALLKVLEEPPSHVTIILATTELEKIPPTIASRAQHFQLKRAPLKEIIQKLKKIAETEKINASDDALELIASSADGSFRDAESLLDQMASLTGSSITTENIENILGKIGFQRTAELAAAVLKNNLEKSIKILSETNESGFNIVELLKDLIIYLRRVAVMKHNPAIRVIFEKELPAEYIKKIEEHAKLFTPDHIELMKNLIKAYGQMRYSPFPIIPFEIALIENLKK